MEACAALTRRVEHLEYDKVAQALEITKLKRRVKKLEKRNKVRVLKLRRLQRVGTSQRVETSNDIMMDDESNQRRMIAEIDQDDAVILKDDKEEDKVVVDAIKDVEESKVDEIVDVVTTAMLITKVVTAASETVTAASAIITTAKAQVPAATPIAAPARVVAAPSRRRKGVVIKDPKSESTTSIIIPAKTISKDKGKGILVEEPKPLKKKQQIELDEQYARELHAELNKDIDWDEAIDHVKRKAKEDHTVKRYQNPNRALQKLNEILAKRATKRRRLDEEVEELRRHLWIVPNEDDDVYTEATPLARKVPVVDYHNTQRNEHGPANVKGWKLLESCGVQIITFTSTQLILLVERKYPLTRFTLDQMLNAVRLEVEEESKVSLELLRFNRQQHQEGQHE
uniref:Uncharacterized protein n=1 Tax=Tanacetum cinerariifolium TaxID=118510 RepID=A0A6L2K4D0_TANCI|nr:hypothetical protein [Tanacetum cinerariifolium]